MNEEMLKIRVTIADRSYQLNVKRDEEEIYRDAAKAIEERLNVYRQKYSIEEEYDKTALSMIAFDFAFHYYKLKKEKDMEPMIDKLKELNQELAEYLDI